MEKVVAIIPARGGSKGIPEKNIKLLGGYPLIAFSTIAAKLCSQIDRVIVSTDCPEIADIAKSYCAEVPFLRPPELARDNSPDMDFVHHALNWLEDYEGGVPKFMVHLRPTTPLRDPILVDLAINTMKSENDATSLRSVHELSEPPQKMFGIQHGFLVGLFPNDPRPEYYNFPRQTFPPAYYPNGYVDIIRTDFVRRSQNLHGDRILAFTTPATVEMDGLEDFEYAEYLLERRGHPLHEHLKANCVSMR
ncbi:acylneuraminate cytidylyltransferase family protein [Acidobacteria bacterium AH-259-D05]|nr:acylneuraminate cytidylyltransferase family protein [Acidobacteria bacterium AH-259-D05]